MEPFYVQFWLPYILIFSRVIAFVFALPFFSWRGIPVMLRIFIAVSLSFLLLLGWEGEISLPGSDLEMIIMVGREVMTGLILGFFVYLFLSVFLMSGQFMDHKAGLLMAGTFDPLFAGQVTIMGQFFYFLAIVFYLTVNGHHLLFISFKEGLVLMPLGGPFASVGALWDFVRVIPRMFLLAFQITAPVIVILWLMDFALGLLSKAVPQIHVFIVGLPLKIALMLLIFVYMLPFLGGIMGDVFDMLARDFVLVMRSWSM